MKRYYSLIILFLYVTSIAQIPSGYYDNAEGKMNATLKTALSGIISSGYHDVRYSGLYNVYAESDNTSDGRVWDMYSTCTWYHGQKKCGTYKNVCDCYNREHLVPQSWFKKKSPMVSDAFHVVPTDGKVNGQRSNYPFGECATGVTLTNGRGKLGNSTFSGYSGKVFEPDDEFKGDIARSYFYFATRYQNKISGLESNPSFNATTYPSFSTWTQALLLKWHRQDPVSQKEIDRNNAIYDWQNNRNPFIDHPELAEHIWGNKMGTVWNEVLTEIEDVATTFGIHIENKTLVVETNDNDLTYKIHNTNGQLVKQGILNTNKYIQLNRLNFGIYIISLQGEKSHKVERFILK